MTKIVKRRMYCDKCKKIYTVPVVLSTNSYSLKIDKTMQDKMENGSLFKNFCPVCKKELRNKENE